MKIVSGTWFEEYGIASIKLEDGRLLHTEEEFDYESIREAIYWTCINEFWKGLNFYRQLYARYRYDKEPFLRGAYRCPKELAYNRFSREEVQTAEFLIMEKVMWLYDFGDLEDFYV